MNLLVFRFWASDRPKNRYTAKGKIKVTVEGTVERTVKGTVKGKGSGCEKSAEISLSLSLRQMGEWSSNYNRQLNSSFES
jgi:hypothetical protein